MIFSESDSPRKGTRLAKVLERIKDTPVDGYVTVLENEIGKTDAARNRSLVRVQLATEKRFVVISEDREFITLKRMC